MDINSTLGIFLLILALSLTLGAVSAEEVEIDDNQELLSIDSQEDSIALAESNIPTEDDYSADVGVEVTKVSETEDSSRWLIFAYNNGTDIAVNAWVTIKISDNLRYYDSYAFTGEFDSEYGIWYIGDLDSSDSTGLFINVMPIASGQQYYYIGAEIMSETFDPDLSNNNVLIEWGSKNGTSGNGTENHSQSDSSAKAISQSLPAAGNPVAVALFAVLTLIGIGGKRKKL